MENSSETTGPESDERRFFLFAAAVDPSASRGILFFGNLRPFRNEMMMVMRWERGACGRRGRGVKHLYEKTGRQTREKNDRKKRLRSPQENFHREVRNTRML